MNQPNFTNIEAVKAAVAAANACADEKDSELAAANACADEKDSELAAANARADVEKTRADTLNARQSLHAHIYHLYAHCFQTLRIRQKGPETTAVGSTSVPGRTCPRKLLPWNDFPGLHQQKFTDLSNAFGDQLLLPPFSDACALQRTAQEWSHDSENESSRFCSMLIELHVAKIASTWRQIVSEEAEEVEFCPNTAYITEYCE
ncbi:hypothetical protein HOO65_100016 [Ceratocystis lukuohia]|uniref:Uncharacterized protein n=1 Tax=Ceratocystis lukuohia TaxID=2019550 RepID=A0ABR4M8L7_9PEZI